MKTYQDLEDFFLKNVEGGHEKKRHEKAHYERISENYRHGHLR